MKEKDRKILNKLIRDHEDVMGASRAAMLAIESFIRSIQQLRCGIDQVQELYLELAEAIKNTEPKVVPLIHLIEEFEKEIQPFFSEDIEQVRNRAVEILTEKLEVLRTRVGQVIEKGLSFINKGDVILVHTASRDVINMLVMAREVFQKRFSALVLKQDFVKTKQLIQALTQAGVDLTVIPEYNLSHCLDRANKLFIGAVSITRDHKVVTAIGTANIVGLCHLNQIPVYLFATTLKISHQDSGEHRIHTKIEPMNHDDCAYRLTTHSHDLLDLNLVDVLVTEDGAIDKDKIAGYVQQFTKST
ncbi:MAG: hypothetical protein K9L59_17960 [Desulfobacterales bacterium]|nr:hypothetical protein [Desulfobacterales bacterium]